MLQKEVVDRLAAGPGSKNYGRLSIMMQYYCHVSALFNVPPQAFSPPPKVESAIVKLVPYTDLPVKVKNTDHFKLIVTSSFSQRRKTLRNNLKKILTDDLIIGVGIDPVQRAETISVNSFAALSDAYTDSIS